MVKHIVLFKLKESLTSAEKADVMNRFKVYTRYTGGTEHQPR